jgi:hypothetical protein
MERHTLVSLHYDRRPVAQSIRACSKQVSTHNMKFNRRRTQAFERVSTRGEANEIYGGSMSSRGTDSLSQTQEEINLRPDFQKGARCPSSEELLRHCQQPPDIERRRCAEIECHLAICDFCCAEQYLLTAYPPHNIKPDYTSAQIPIHLYTLARALLVAPRSPHFAKAMHASVALTLTDA